MMNNKQNERAGYKNNLEDMQCFCFFFCSRCFCCWWCYGIKMKSWYRYQGEWCKIGKWKWLLFDCHIAIIIISKLKIMIINNNLQKLNNFSLSNLKITSEKWIYIYSPLYKQCWYYFTLHFAFHQHNIITSHHL